MRKGSDILFVNEAKNHIAERRTQAQRGERLDRRCGCFITLTATLEGFIFRSRKNQLRYIWSQESKCNLCVLGYWETKYELRVHVKKHLDVHLSTVDRSGESQAHGEKAEKGYPLSLVASNPVLLTDDIRLRQVSDSQQGVALSLDSTAKGKKSKQTGGNAV